MLKLSSASEMPVHPTELFPLGLFHVKTKGRIDMEGHGFVIRDGETVEPVEGKIVRRLVACVEVESIHCVDAETSALILEARGEDDDTSDESDYEDLDDEDVEDLDDAVGDFVEGEDDEDDEDEDEDEFVMPETKDALLALADEFGVEVDKRWGVAKLQDAIGEFLDSGEAN